MNKKIILIFCMVLLLVSLSSAKNFNIANTSDSLFFVNGTSGLVGIGTSSPNGKLELYDTYPILRLSGHGSNLDDNPYGAIEFYNRDPTGDGPQVAAKIEVLTENTTVNYGRGGELAFYTTSGDGISEGADAPEVMRISGTGNVGIGTTSPTETLHVHGDIGVNPDAGGKFIFDANSGANSYMAYRSTGTAGVDIYTDGTLGLTVQNNGNVGIGTTTPSEKLRIYSNDATDTLRLDGGSGFSGRLIEGYVNNDTRFYFDVNGNLRFSTGGDAYVINDAGGKLHLGTDDSYDLTIISGGNVGIGTTSPSNKLDVEGDLVRIEINNTQVDKSGAIGFWNPEGLSSGIVSYASEESPSNETWIKDYRTNGKVVLAGGSGAVADLVVDSSGNVGIGTTSPSNKLQIDSSGNSVLHLRRVGTEIYDSAHVLGEIVFSGDDVYGSEEGIGAKISAFADNIWGGVLSNDYPTKLVFYTNPDGTGALSERMRITSSGNVGIGTTTPSQTLDVRGQGNFSGTIFINNGTDISLFNGTGLIDAVNTSYNIQVLANGTVDANTLDGYDSSYFMPLNTSVSGDFDFNGGWQNGGLSIDGGNLFAQTIYVYNISGLNVNTLSINGSILPPVGFDDTFDIGSTALRWRDIHISGEIASNGTGDNYFLGNVGIGTESPSYKVHINVSDNSQYQLRIQHTDDPVESGGAAGIYLDNKGDFSQIMFMRIDDTGAHIGTTDNEDLRFYTDNTLRMIINDVNGYVGIGTSSPSSLLHIKDGNAGTFLNITETGGASYAIGMDDASSNLDIKYGGSDVFTIKSAGGIILNNGNVGIGTTSPNSILELASTAPKLTFNETDLNKSYISLDASRFDFVNDQVTDSHIRLSNNAVKIGVGAVEDGSVWGGVDINNVMSVTSSKVGIGTTNPNANLHISDISPGNRAQLWLTSNGSETSKIGFGDVANDDEGRILYNHASNFMALYTNDAEAVRIDSDGNVGIGTTTPSNKLDVRGVGNFSGTVYINNGTDISTFVTSGAGNSSSWNRSGTSVILHHVGDSVGIGTASPSAKLEVNGSMQVNGSIKMGLGTDSATEMYFYRGGTQRGAIGTYGGVFTMYGGTLAGSDRYQLVLDADGDVRLDSNDQGNVGIGPTGNDPAYRLTVAGDVNLNNTLYVNESSGNVGIGTSSPSQTLDVRGQGNFSGTIFINNVTDISTLGGGGIFVNATPWSYINTTMNRDLNISGVIYVNASSGNVGIGTASPDTKLHVESAVNNSGTVNNPNSATADSPILKLHNSRTDVNDWVGVEMGIWGATADRIWLQTIANGNDDLDFRIGRQWSGDGGLTEFMRIDSSGNVGIGTTGPGAKLDITGGNLINILVGGDSTSATTRTDATQKILRMGVPHYNTSEEPVGVFYVSSGNGVSSVNIGGGGTSLLNLPENINFYTASDDVTTGSGAVAKMVINNQGNVGIGTTTPSQTLDVRGQGNFSGTIFINNGTDISTFDSFGDIFVNETGDTMTGALQIDSSDDYALNVSNALYVNGTSGNVGIGTGSPSSSNKLEVSGGNLKVSSGYLKFDNGYGLFGGTGGTGSPNLLTYDDRLEINGGGVNDVKLRVVASDGQVANIQEWQNYSGTNLMVIDSSGQVGINTSTPSDTLSVVGGVNIYLG